MDRNKTVAILLCAVAVLVIIGGFASFSGMAVYSMPIYFEMEESGFAQSDIFDVNAVLNVPAILADESIVVYVDGKVVGVIPVKDYLESNGFDYGIETKEGIGVINLPSAVRINLADFVFLDSIHPGNHVVRVRLSEGDAVSDAKFAVF